MLLRKKNFRLPAGLRLRLVALTTGFGAIALGGAVAAALLSPLGATIVALLYAFAAFVFVRASHSEIRADDRGIQTAVRQAFRPRRISWKEIEQFDVTECAGGEKIVVARLWDDTDVVLPELKSEYPWLARWGRNADAVNAICDQLNRRRMLEVRMWRTPAPEPAAPAAHLSGTGASSTLA
jgi:hypothetical protein